MIESVEIIQTLLILTCLLLLARRNPRAAPPKNVARGPAPRSPLGVLGGVEIQTFWWGSAWGWSSENLGGAMGGVLPAGGV